MEKTLFDKINPPVFIKTDRLTIEEITEKDGATYQSLYLDDQLNKWWGYDYREDLNGKEPTAEYFLGFQKLLKEKREEYSLAVKKDGVMIGELVLYNFEGATSLEMGFRFFKEHHGKGYAVESAGALKDYVFNTLGASRLRSRCFKENIPSRKLIERLGLKLFDQNQTHYFFDVKNEKTKK